MPKLFKVITFGGLTQDIMFYTDKAVLFKNKKDPLRQELIAFEYGAKIRSEKVGFVFGGGGGNSAISFTRLGLKTAVAGKIGYDRIGDDYLDNFKSNKVGLDLIERDRLAHSGFSFILNYGKYNEHVVFSYRGANDNLIIKEQKLNSFNAKWYYLASLPDKNLEKNLGTIFKSAANKKIKIAWNPGVSELKKGYSGLKKYLIQTDVLIVNKDEAIDLAQSNKMKSEDINILLKTLKGFGPKIVSISCGHLGAYAYDGSNIFYEKALNVLGINTTGAGDAFGSSLVAGLMLFNNDLKKALKLGIIRSSQVIQKIGAQAGLLNKNESLRLLK